jgi:xanthine dehydrogenase YagS FAD-binding subunit
MCVALAALGAIIHVQGVAGEKQILFENFHLLPGYTPDKENVLEPGDLITAVELPPLGFARRSHYLKVRDRSSYEFALASAAVALDISGGVILSARVALGGVGTKPWRSKEAEHALVGTMATKSSYQNAAEAALLNAIPHQHNAFKIPLAKRTLVRALETTGGMK